MENKKTNRGKGLCLIFILVFCSLYIIGKCSKGSTHESAKPWEDCFSKWDGSHIELVREVKALMNDPGSFEHVETLYSLQGDKMILTMKFRGKNAFGGVITNTARAESNMSCQILGRVIIQ